MKKERYLRTAIVIATYKQLKDIGVNDIPTGALVRVVNEDHITLESFGKIVEIEYKIKGFNYLIPEKYIL